MDRKRIAFIDESNSIFSTKMPYVLWITMTYISSVILQTIDTPMIFESFVVGCFMVQHIYLYWVSDTLIEKKPIFYFIGQNIIVFASSYILEKGSIALLIGLLPLLISQSLIIFKQKMQVFFIFIFLYSQYCVAIYLNYGTAHIVLYIFAFMLILFIVLYYYTVYVRQVRARLRTQYYVEELELAHKKLEELTLANERERMARDLHDTFAQGLAALVMQLEAVDSHLEKKNIEKSQDIIQISLVTARKTLKEARLVIDDLRESTEKSKDLRERILEVINEFEKLTSMKVQYNIQSVLEISNFKKEHIVYLVSECFTNIRKHAKATEVYMNMEVQYDQVYIEVRDNGIGCSNISSVKSGKYGLLGMSERIHMMNGKIEFDSSVGNGTKINVSIPL